MRLTNWYTHPADNRYHVFEFRDAGLADEFERDLKAGGIDYEREVHEDGSGEGIVGDADFVARFGVHRNVFRAALRLNHLLHGRHRAPFIAHAGLRWLMLLFTAAMVGLALMGWMRS